MELTGISLSVVAKLTLKFDENKNDRRTNICAKQQLWFYRVLFVLLASPENILPESSGRSGTKQQPIRSSAWGIWVILLHIFWIDSFSNSLQLPAILSKVSISSQFIRITCFMNANIYDSVHTQCTLILTQAHVRVQRTQFSSLVFSYSASEEPQQINGWVYVWEFISDMSLLSCVLWRQRLGRRRWWWRWFYFVRVSSFYLSKSRSHVYPSARRCQRLSDKNTRKMKWKEYRVWAGTYVSARESLLVFLIMRIYCTCHLV